MAKFKKLLKRIFGDEKSFYKFAIEMHNNERLRNLAGNSYLIEGTTECGPKRYLGYGRDHGFSLCFHESNWRPSDYEYSPFFVKDGKLYTDADWCPFLAGEMLEIFPKLTISELERAVHKLIGQRIEKK